MAEESSKWTARMTAMPDNGLKVSTLNWNLGPLFRARNCLGGTRQPNHFR